jgi:hypothetical protein
MNIAAVTTMNIHGLAKYGQRMVASFEKHWPADIPLYLYAEGWDAQDLLTGHFNRSIRVVDLLVNSPWLSSFKARHKGDPPHPGFRHDAIRFSHKVAALTHAVDRLDVDYVIWIDADVYAHSPIFRENIELLLPNGDQWLAWLERGRRVYPECGFYIVNCRHPSNDRLIGELEDMYIEDKLYSLPEWHDSYVLWEIVKRSSVMTKSLSGAYSNTGHPFINGPLGQWFDHLKGARKDAGRSHIRDLKRPRDELYWKQR